MATVFKKPINNLTTTLGAAYTPGSGTMTVRAGDGARFGAVSASSPIRFSVVTSTLVNDIGQVAPPSAIAIYTATGISGDTLTGVAISEGTSDQTFAIGDYLAVVPTAATFADIQGAVNSLEASSATETAQVATNTADIATNAANLSAHVADVANPHNVTAAQVGASVAQWNANALQGKAIDATAPTGGQGLVWDAATSKWVPASVPLDNAVIHTTGDETKTGTLTVPLRDKGGQVHNVLSYGADPTGATPSTAAILAAQAAAGSTTPVYFPPGTYLVDDSLFSSLTGYSSYTWIGARSARGCNAGTSFPASTIRFRPVDTTKWLVMAANTTAGQEATVIGPYIHKDLAFDVGDANGFRFGLEDVNNDGTSDTVVDGSGQAYVSGVRFEGCALSATAADRASDANGVITRSGRILVHLTKCFESALTDTSFYGGDTQVRTWGCDKPSVDRCRFQGAHLPIEFHGSGSFTVQHTARDCQFEGWTFCPILSDHVSLVCSDCRFELNDNTPVGSGKHALTPTAIVTLGDNHLIFSSSMDGILFPGLSVVEVSDSGNTLLGYVTVVSGTNVYLDGSSTAFPWGAIAATVTRYHGTGPLHYSDLGASLDGIDADAATNCPAFVYVASRGTMAISGAHRAILGHSPTPSMVVGNRLFWPSPGAETEQNLGGHMSFSACDPFIVADSSHPHVVIEDVRPAHGARDWDQDVRARLGRLDDDRAVARRVWAFTPRSTGTYTDDSYKTPFVKVAGDANTTQATWAWWVHDAAQPLVIRDETLPADATCKIRLTFRARSVGATGTLTYATRGNSTSATTDVALTDAWATITSIVDVPAEWRGTKSTATGFSFTGSGYYLAAVLVEELPPSVPERVTGDLTVDGAIAGSGASLTGVVHLTGTETIAGPKSFTDPANFTKVFAADQAWTVTASSTNSAANVSSGALTATHTDDSTADSTASVRYAVWSQYQKTGSANMTGFVAGSFQAASTISGGSVANLWDFSSRVEVTTPGSVSNIYHYHADSSYGTTGTVTKRVGFHANDFAPAACTDQYGVYVENLAAGTGTNYAVYTAGTTPSYFGGAVAAASFSGDGSALTGIAHPTAAHGESALGVDYHITTTASFVDTGLSVSIPSAGTYLLNYNVRIDLQVSGADGWISAEIYDDNAAAAVANSQRLVYYTSGTGEINMTTAFSIVATFAGATTVRLYAARNSTGSPTWTASHVLSNSDGYTTLSYVKLS